MVRLKGYRVIIIIISYTARYPIDSTVSAQVGKSGSARDLYLNILGPIDVF